MSLTSSVFQRLPKNYYLVISDGSIQRPPPSDHFSPFPFVVVLYKFDYYTFEYLPTSLSVRPSNTFSCICKVNLKPKYPIWGLITNYRMLVLNKICLLRTDRNWQFQKSMTFSNSFLILNLIFLPAPKLQLITA